MASIHSVHGSILTRNHHPNPSKISIGLDVSEIVLTALVIAAKTSSIPYLQDAAQQALNIVNIVKVPLYFSIFSQSIIDQEWENLGCQESQRLVQTIGE